MRFNAVQITGVSITKRDELFEAYMREIGKYSVRRWSAQEEADKFNAYHKQPTQRAKQEIAKHYMLFVISIAKRYEGMGIELNDLISEGNIGLLDAIELFDTRQGVRFISFAVYHIRKTIVFALNDRSRTVRIPKNRIKDAMYMAISGDAPQVGDEDKTMFDNFTTTDTRANKYDDTNYIAHIISVYLSYLSERERDILCSLLGLGCPQQSMWELAIKYNKTEERIRQIKCEAIAKLQEIAKQHKCR